MTNLVSLITPTNLLAERDKFFASTKYNPTFSYLWQDQEIDKQFSFHPKQLLWEAIKSQDNLLITQRASEFFEVKISEPDLARAIKLAETKGKISSGSSHEYAYLLQQALRNFDIHEVQVIQTSEAGFNARPNHKANVILISQHIHFDYFSMEGGVNHELAHVLRYHNGKHNSIKRNPAYLPTEEGLASWCQDNTNDDNGLAQHAIEYVASSVGLQGSLRDLYDCMRELGMSPDLAWKRASRHKFGFVDTSLPGDILKPAMYYAGEIKIAQLSTQEKLRLFVGKIALSDLSDHPQYHGLWPAEQLIKYFKL